MMTSFSVETMKAELSGKNPRAIMKTALESFENIALSFSGAEDVILIDMAVKIRPDIRVFCLDTGRLHPETYRFLETVRNHYGIALEVLTPDFAEVEALVNRKGLFSFFEEGHTECCRVRKVSPLKRILSGLDAWITGQRRDQSLTRIELEEVEVDTALAVAGQQLIKFNPLTHWTSQQVWDYIEALGVPFNPLHRHGFSSIGCEPCTRPILPHQHEREGRWWWEDSAKKECGLHAGNREVKA